MLDKMGKSAREAARLLAGATTHQKNEVLLAMAEELEKQSATILAASREDTDKAKQTGMSSSLLDRLALSADRIAAMAEGVRQVASLPDPVGEVMDGFRRPNGLRIEKVRVPLGVIGIIYEARPNVTSDAAALCLKAGNAVILRGGKEAIASNTAIAGALRDGLTKAGLPADAIQLIPDTSRETAAALMRLNTYLDVLIPRGGAGLIRSVVENATVPVLETGTGNCHIYVDAAADLTMACAIAVNAKASRPSVCNAAETLLVHAAVAEQALPMLAQGLIKAGVRLHGCARTSALLPDVEMACAGEEDWATEYLDYDMAVKVVDSLEEAMDHIARYGTGHSECIVTDSQSAAQTFTDRVDAAAVYINASTRFTDGAEFGLGAEIGISTQKLHARGPMGLRELTTAKYIITGNGQIR